MDPTAPNNNGGQPPQSPVQPGQFVVAGDDTSAPVQAVQPSVSLAGERPPAAIPNTPLAAASGAAQPDPTPFNPTGLPGQPPTGEQPQPPAPSGGSGSKKGLIIILAVVLLLAILAVVGYFFVMPMLQKEDSTSTVDEQIVETSPAPIRTETDPGFGQLPESTESTSVDTQTEETTVDPLTIPAQ